MTRPLRTAGDSFLCPPILLFVALSLSGPSARAETRLSADEAVRLALSRNLDLQADRQRVAEAQAELRGARLRTPFNPRMEASGGRRGSSGGAGADLAVGIGQEIEIGGQRNRRIAVGTARLELTQTEVQVQAQEIATEVRRVFAAAVLARERLDYGRQLEALAKNLIDSAQVRFEAGASTKLELNLAKAELGKAHRERILAENATTTALIELRRLLGMAKDEPITFATDATLPERLPPTSEVLPRALSLRPDVLTPEREAALAQAEERLARAALTPNLELGVETGREGDESVAGLRVGAQIPLFNRQQAEIQGAEARRRRAELVRQALRFRAERDLLAAEERYHGALEALKVYRNEVLATTEENIELLNEAFRSGKVDFLQVLSVQKDLVDQRQLYLETLQSAQEALIDWQLAAGVVIPPDVPAEERAFPNRP
jgi:outer membrane protein, heavy metal efflux system